MSTRDYLARLQADIDSTREYWDTENCPCCAKRFYANCRCSCHDSDETKYRRWVYGGRSYSTVIEGN